MEFKYWTLLIPYSGFRPHLPNEAVWIKGQLEPTHVYNTVESMEAVGETPTTETNEVTIKTEELFWKFVICFKQRITLKQVKTYFKHGHAHAIPTAILDVTDAYVSNPKTRIPETNFEYGTLPRIKPTQEQVTAVLNTPLVLSRRETPEEEAARIEEHQVRRRIERLDNEALERERLLTAAMNSPFNDLLIGQVIPK